MCFHPDHFPSSFQYFTHTPVQLLDHIAIQPPVTPAFETLVRMQRRMGESMCQVKEEWTILILFDIVYSIFGITPCQFSLLRLDFKNRIPRINEAGRISFE